MNLDSRPDGDLATHPCVDQQSEPVSNMPAQWHRPLITIIEIKRTMFFVGSFLDGIQGSTS